MRILVLTNSFPSPSETFVLNHLLGLARRGHELTVLAKRAKGGAAVADYPFTLIHYASRSKRLAPLAALAATLKALFTRPRSALRVLAAVARHGDAAVTQALALAPRLAGLSFDLTHAEFGPLGNMALALRDCGVGTGPICVSFRGADLTSYLARKPRSYALLSKEGALALPVCEAFKPLLLARGFDEKAIRVYRSAVDLAALGPPRGAPGPVERPRLIGAGRFVAKKGFDRALTVLARLRAKGLDASLTLVGDGPEAGALRALAEREGLSPYLSLPGWLGRADLVETLKASDLFLGTSLTPPSGETEGIPNVIKEAMALGLPVAAFDHAGVGELVLQRQTGLLAPEGDAEALADLAYELLTAPESAARLADAARRLVFRDYSLEGQAELAERWYAELVQAAGRP